jgi:hypothetical protein
MALCLFAAPAALAQTTPTITFGHDDSLDDPNDHTPAENDQEIHSGLFNAGLPYDPEAQPDDQRAQTQASGNSIAPAGFDEDNPTFEKFPFEVPEGDRNGSFSVTVTWQESLIDLDVYVYRERDDGTLDPTPVAQAASVANPEVATRFEPIAGDPIRAGTYWVYVDNWCSHDQDPWILFFFEGSCTGDPDAPLSGVDEDDFVGQVTFTAFNPDNQLPSASITGPPSGLTGQELSFQGSGSDSDGVVQNYSYDLDGDGRFEYDNGANPGPVTARFSNAGVYNVGVRIGDDRGGSAYASTKVSISGPPAAGDRPTVEGVINSFKLNRPVFGGRSRNRLVIRYRLNDNARTIVSLYRGKRRVRRLFAGNRESNRTYKLTVRPRGLKRGATYTIRMYTRNGDGEVQRARLSAKRL